MNSTHLPARSRTARLLLTLQWIVFVCLLLVALRVITIEAVNLPSPPTALLVISIVAISGLLLAHLPPGFRRLPRLAKLAAYVAILPAFILLGLSTLEMRAAYERTPQGRKEAAAKAAADRKDAAEWERRDAVRQAQNHAAYVAGAPARDAQANAQKLDACNALVGQVVDGDKVLEVNDVSPEVSYEPNEVLTCGGDAITSHGNARIQFGLVTTPQGRQLVSVRFP